MELLFSAIGIAELLSYYDGGYEPDGINEDPDAVDKSLYG
jgi:hypothetical protein